MLTRLTCLNVRICDYRINCVNHVSCNNTFKLYVLNRSDRTNSQLDGLCLIYIFLIRLINRACMVQIISGMNSFRRVVYTGG